MILQEFINNPMGALMKSERYLNDGSPSGFSDTNTTSVITRPKSQTEFFQITEMMFPQSLIKDYGICRTGYINDNCMYLHPDIVAKFHGLNEIGTVFGDGLKVAPTASGRTLLAIEKEFFVKLAYPQCLGRSKRHMNSEIIISACSVTKQLVDLINKGQANPAFSFLREDFGRVVSLPAHIFDVNSSNHYELGVLFRDLNPYPYQFKKEMMIPFFALFSREYDPFIQEMKKQQDKPLIFQLFERQNKSIEDFLLQSILLPLYNTYFDALLFGGIELEAHAQNMLITIDENFEVQRIVCRDLESAGRDSVLMDALGICYDETIKYKLNTPSKIIDGQKYSNYHITHSFMFDFKLGEYITTPLLDKIEEYSEVDREFIRTSICDYNRQFISRLPDDFFPNEWCRYENINWELEKRPREYIWDENPKYRWVD